ncbi:DUF1449 domain-containing protein [Gammaproteobacteria bacterium 42_54_T18]|nr:DUF1449 domain-containing protein [Gammaproteobacteria bacterium 42_54_T18]
MDPFYQNIASFPTAFFTFFLALSMVYWCIAALGFIDVDVLDLDGIDVDGKMDINADTSISSADVVAGLIMRLGLSGIPVTIIITLVSLIGWILCYYIVYAFFDWVPEGVLRYLVSLPIIAGCLYVAAVLTAVAVKPFRSLFAKLEQKTEKKVLGQTAIVRTMRVDNGFGEATVEDGGAGLIFKVRALGDVTFAKGDRVVLLEYLKENNTYNVISEDEFKN